MGVENLIIAVVTLADIHGRSPRLGVSQRRVGCRSDETLRLPGRARTKPAGGLFVSEPGSTEHGVLGRGGRGNVSLSQLVFMKPVPRFYCAAYAVA